MEKQAGTTSMASRPPHGFRRASHAPPNLSSTPQGPRASRGPACTGLGLRIDTQLFPFRPTSWPLSLSRHRPAPFPPLAPRPQARDPVIPVGGHVDLGSVFLDSPRAIPASLQPSQRGVPCRLNKWALAVCLSQTPPSGALVRCGACEG